MIAGLVVFLGVLVGVGLRRRGRSALGTGIAVACAALGLGLALAGNPRPLATAVAVILIDAGIAADRPGRRAVPLAVLSAGILCLLAVLTLPG